jgi:predicted DCC family thiol-disulfide oxidoreductase YuxK
MSAQGAHHAIVLFDGDCNFCNRSVQFILNRDKAERFMFASQQSVAGQAALAKTHTTELLPDSMVLIDTDGLHTQSTAALRIARGLGLPWSLAGIGLVVPKFVRDAAYRVIARNRYRWFGKRESCMMPTPELAKRFLDIAERRESSPSIKPGHAHT